MTNWKQYPVAFQWNEECIYSSPFRISIGFQSLFVDYETMVNISACILCVFQSQILWSVSEIIKKMDEYRAIRIEIFRFVFHLHCSRWTETEIYNEWDRMQCGKRLNFGSVGNMRANLPDGNFQLKREHELRKWMNDPTNENRTETLSSATLLRAFVIFSNTFLHIFYV